MNKQEVRARIEDPDLNGELGAKRDDHRNACEHEKNPRSSPWDASAVTTRINSLPTRKAGFIEPMECLAVAKLPQGRQWVYEIKLDGYRAIAVKSGGKVTLFSKRRKSFNRKFPRIVGGLADLPDNTVIDGEVVALDESGRPDFNRLRNFRHAASNIHYFVFDS